MPPRSGSQILRLDVKSEIESLISLLKGRGGGLGDLVSRPAHRTSPPPFFKSGKGFVPHFPLGDPWALKSPPTAH